MNSLRRLRAGVAAVGSRSVVAFLAIVLTGCSVVPDLKDATGQPDRPDATGYSKSDIFVVDVVQRVKCEIAVAFRGRLEIPGQVSHVKGGGALPSWLADWTVKADLTLQANEQGGISPSGSYTEFRKSAVNAAAGPTSSPGTTLGTVQQFVTVTLNANAGEQAVRSETLSFTLAMKELDDWFIHQGWQICRTPMRRELLGHLGLVEWVNAALTPVEFGVLQAGKHPAPGSGSAAKPSIVGKPAPVQGFAEDQGTGVRNVPEAKAVLELALKNVKEAVSTANDSYDSIAKVVADLEASQSKASDMVASYAPISTPATSERLRSAAQKIRSNMKNARDALLCTLQQLCGDGLGDCSAYMTSDGLRGWRTGVTRKCDAGSLDRIERAHGKIEVPVVGTVNERLAVEEFIKGFTANSSGDIHELDLKYVIKAQDAAEQARRYAHVAKNLADYAKQLSDAALPAVPDPPIEGIGHLVQFVVAYGGGVSPNWTLIALKGPGINGPLISGSVNRTHILQLAMGSSKAAVQTEANRILNNQILLNR
jgi:hypothetical protein